MANNSVVITFPKGVSVYPALDRPDTKFDELGQYKADFKLSAQEAQPYVEKLSAIWKAHVGKPIKRSDNPLFYNEIDPDTGDETGFVVFKVRVKNKMNKKGKLWDRQPTLIDAKKGNFPTDVAIWGGSVYRVQAEVYEWMAAGKKGVSLQPVMVQVIDLVTGAGRGDTGAFDEEDGYESSCGTDPNAFDDEACNSDGVDY